MTHRLLLALNIAWRLPLPAWSGSTPIVWGDHVFLNVPEDRNLWLWAVDRTRGTVPAVSDGQISVRTDSFLYAIGRRKP